jgi:iron complex outermembrane recepter protein
MRSLRLNPPPALRPVPLVVAMFWMPATPTWAQDSAPQLEVITVTGQKRPEPLQEVPAAVKAFSAKKIEDMGIKTTQDFISMTPNVSFENSFTYGNSSVSIRGVNQLNNGDSPVAVVIDGVPQNNQKQLKMNLFDIQRIEVFKGPQGALHGRNAIGGAINIETKPPTNEFEGFGEVALGNGKSREFTGGVSGALVKDTVLFRIGGQALKSAGLIANTYLSRATDTIDHDGSVRGKLLIYATDDLKIDLRASAVGFSAGATWDGIVRNGSPDTVTAPASNLLGNTKGRTIDLSAKIDWETRIGNVTAITGYTKLRERYRGDLDFTNPTDPDVGILGNPVDYGLPPGTQFGQGQNLSVKLLSQELRIASPDKQRFRWIAGLYYLKTKRDLDSRTFIDTNNELSQFDDPLATFDSQFGRDNNTATAVFGQTDYDIGLRTTLSASLRYDRDHRKQTDLIAGGTRAATYANWQPKLTVSHKLNTQQTAYLTYSTGFRSGGFNAPGYGDFKAETLANYEAGLKSALLANRLFLNVSFFVADSKNYQYFRLNSDAVQLIVNIERVRMRGLDFDFNWLAAKGLQFDGGLGVTLSTIGENASEPSTVGNYTPNATPWKLNLGAQYEAPLSVAFNGFMRFDWEHRSKKYWDPDNAASTQQQNLVSARVGIQAKNNKWSVMLVGRNLLNERYYSDYGSAKYFGSPLGVDTGSLAPPRTFGVEARLRF